jgi:signal transduction histidine kinase
LDPETSHAKSVLTAEALVERARALSRAGREEEAQSVYLQLAESPPYLVDGEGMPFSLYGLEGLRVGEHDPENLLSLLAKATEGLGPQSLPALLFWRAVVRGIAGELEGGEAREKLRELEDTITRLEGTVEGLEELRSDFAGLWAGARRGGDTTAATADPIWVPYGPYPWMVGLLPDSEESAARVVVVQPTLLLESMDEPPPESGGTLSLDASADRLAAARANVTLLPTGETTGESLGPELDGLRASFSPGFPAPRDGGGVEGWFYRILLPLILLLTGFTAYLAWRDVKREVEAVRLRSQFVSSVTHELKTPLTSIRMFAETLRLGRHSGPEAQEEYLDTVVHETERLSRLINNVLDFARIDRGEKTYQMAPADVGAAVREAARAVAYPLAQGGYTLTTDIPEDLPQIEADSDALTQAVLNLLSNAIKFSGDGSRIDLRVSREGGDVVIHVEDQGRGIAPQDRELVFEDFYRSADAEREGIPGTGLGLPLVAHVAEAHGGRVEVDSELGRGSTFTVRIPRDGRAVNDAVKGRSAPPVVPKPKPREGGAP